MRVSRDQMMMDIAFMVGQRATCDRRRVGAVISRESRVVSTGYNGPPSGMTHCNHKALGVGGSAGCSQAVHAEANAIIFAARHGIATEGCALYTTCEPCLECAKLIINAGIQQVIYTFPYRAHEGLELLRAAGLRVIQLSGGIVE